MRYVDLILGKHRRVKEAKKKLFAKGKWDVEAYFLGALTAVRQVWYEEKGETEFPEEVEEGLTRLLLDYYFDEATESELKEAISSWLPELEEHKLEDLISTINENMKKPKTEITVTKIRVDNEV